MYIKEFIKTKVDIDFEISTADVYVYKIFKVYLTIKDREGENSNAQQKSVMNSLIEKVTKEMPKLLFTKKFKITKDFKSLLIDEKIYEIPDFFNKETLKSNDLKTWEMVFIYIYDDEINKKVKILLKEPNPNSVEKLRKLKSATYNEDT